eukprot:CAMPEP_0183346674 /NCGR_PEP_ID=MMETSP0164_2-20130417/11719_1 /TAXON_ID=221442 /ORGANISM="Coccolithus pelagicus ssp braarudi, Strain PLY182g" /LENGTH=78 /DNA_ID=CAMNT_0025517985 /DNA_START=640 /DNA_END=873 /DNA_ORIENTATION=+
MATAASPDNDEPARSALSQLACSLASQSRALLAPLQSAGCSCSAMCDPVGAHASMPAARLPASAGLPHGGELESSQSS